MPDSSVEYRTAQEQLIALAESLVDKPPRTMPEARIAMECGKALLRRLAELRGKIAENEIEKSSFLNPR